MKKLFLVLFLSISILGVQAQETVKDFEKAGVEKYKLKDYAGSLEAFTKAIELNTAAGTEDGALYYKACMAAYKAENYEKLALYADKAIGLNYVEKGSKTFAYSSLAHKQLGNAAKEEEVLRAGLAKYPADADLKNDLATRLLKNGIAFYDKAVDFQKQANENVADPAKFDEFVVKANAEFQVSKPILEEGYKLNPTNEQILASYKSALKNIYDNLKTPDNERLVK